LRAVEGLDAAEARELDTLLAAASLADSDEFDYAVAACDLALGDSSAIEPLPAALEARILAGAGDWLASRASRKTPGVVSLEERTVRRDVFTPWAPWLLAAAAALVAVVGWWPRGEGPEPAVESPALVAVADAPDALMRAWSATEDPTAPGAAGEVVWSTARQSGFMRIRGLAVNDPSAEQYQLWIFDRAQDERYPIDGGVFDIPAGAAEALVPIDAKIQVAEPYLFAVTVERPGGVVVSSRERIALVAEV
jgi:hypothetical protein